MTLSEQKAAQRTAEELHKEMKEFFKQQSKNELIRIVFEQIELYKTLQNATRQILEENKSLKAELETLKPSVETPKEQS